MYLCKWNPLEEQSGDIMSRYLHRVWVILFKSFRSQTSALNVNKHTPSPWWKERQCFPLAGLEGHKAVWSTSCPSTSEICLEGGNASQPSACQCLSRVERLSIVIAQLWPTRAGQNSEDPYLLSSCKLFICPTSLSPATQRSLSVVFAPQVFCLHSLDFLLDLLSLMDHKPSKPSKSLFFHQERGKGRRREGMVWWRRDYQCINSYPSSLKIEIRRAVIGRWIE